MKYSICFVVGIAYIAVMVGMTLGSVGQIPSTEPVGYALAFKMLLLTTNPFVLGFIAGRDSK